MESLVPNSAIGPPRSISRLTPGSACRACRKQKMRCIGANQPPCVRCRKAGRQCITTATLTETVSEPSGEPLRAVTSPGEQVLVVESSMAEAGSLSTPESTHGTLSAVPDMYTASPYTLVTQGNQDMSSCLTEMTPDPSALSRELGSGSVVSERDIKQLLQLFNDKLLQHVPVLFADDFKDVDYIIEHRNTLAICIAYTAARMVPGCVAYRNALRPSVISFVQGLFSRPRENDSDDFYNLQSMVILYALSRRCPTSWGKERASWDDVSLWLVKAATEAYAFRIGLHETMGELRKAVNVNGGNHLSSGSLQVKRYLLWLWLYTMAHHTSLITGTPPTVRADESIRSASVLLQAFSQEKSIMRIVGEVELCLVWESLNTHYVGVGEWWCQPTAKRFSHATNEVCDFIDNALEKWYRQWSVLFDEDFAGLGLDFHFRFTRFALMTFAVRSLRNSSDTIASENGPNLLCASYAASTLEWILSLGPLDKDRYRHPGDFPFLMIAFASMFLLQAAQSDKFRLENTQAHLDLVERSATLMIALSLDQYHSPNFYGTAVLKRLQTTRPEFINRNRTESAEQGVTARAPIIPAFEGGELNYDGLFIDPGLDLSNFFPELFFDDGGSLM